MVRRKNGMSGTYNGIESPTNHTFQSDHLETNILALDTNGCTEANTNKPNQTNSNWKCSPRADSNHLLNRKTRTGHHERTTMDYKPSMVLRRDSSSFLLKLRKTFSLDGIDLCEMKDIVLQKYHEVNLSITKRRRRSLSTSVVDDLNRSRTRQHSMPFSYQARQENNTMILKLAKTEQQLHEAIEKNKQMSERLVEKGKQLEDARQEIKTLQEKLEREINYSGELYRKINEVGSKTNNIPTIVTDDVFSDTFSDTDENKNKISTSLNNSLLNDSVEVLEQHLRKRSITPIGDLMLSCTLCNERIKIEELESHSSKCSSGKKSKPTNGIHEKDPASSGMLVATVTCSSRKDDTSTVVKDDCHMYKVICKTTIVEFDKTLLVTERSKEDFLWFKKSLETLHPERVIPPLNFQDDLTANLREIQRFLSRICAHKILKKDTLVRKFFQVTDKELEKIKKNLEHRSPQRLKHQTPAVHVVDKDGILYKTQIYIGVLLQNLGQLVTFFKANDNKTTSGLSKCFGSLSDGEPADTYLKSIASSLASIIGGLENKSSVIYDESVLAEDLESILNLVCSADELLTRVENSVETFLYWEEEIRVFEEMKTEGLVTEKNGKDISHLWAEASSNCRTAKDQLEKMCRNLSSELHDFDMRKELELKQVLIEYAESRFDVFEKMQSKWFGVKLILDAEIIPSVRAIDFTNNHH